MSRPAPVYARDSGLAGFALACFAPQLFNDGDSWWHLAAGQWMLAHGAVPKSDIFSFTMAGKPWDAQEWLSEILMALVFRLPSPLGGWSGLHLLFGFAIGAAAAVVAYFVRARTAAMPAFVLSLVG